MDVINIFGNPLRTLSSSFLVIVPSKELHLLPGRHYNCNVDKYGIVGSIYCLRKTAIALSAFDDRLNELTDCLPDYASWYKERKYFLTDEIQVGYFRLLSRLNSTFTQMIEAELKSSGVILHPQMSLF